MKLIKNVIHTFSFIFPHIDCNRCAFGIVPRGHVLLQVAERTQRLRHKHSVQVSALVNPASVFTERVQRIERNEIGFEILFPISDTFETVIGIT